MFLVSATSDYSSFEIHHNQISYSGSIHYTFDYDEEGARWTLAMQGLEISLNYLFWTRVASKRVTCVMENTLLDS